MAGLFGGIPKKKTLFGQIPMPPGYLGGQGIGDGNIERQQMEMGAQQPNMQAMTKKPSFLGEGGAGRAIAGSIGDFLLQYTGGQPIYAPAMQEQRQLQQRQQQQEQQRQASRSDWLWQQQWKKDNPDPQNPYRWESNDGSLMQIGPDGKPVQVYQDPTPKINWIQAKDPVSGKIELVPMGPNGPLGGAPTPEFAGWPDDEGGQTPPASATFPRR